MDEGEVYFAPEQYVELKAPLYKGDPTMLSKLGSVIGNLFTPLKVKAVDSTQSNKLNHVGEDGRGNPHQNQGKKKDSEPKPEERQAQNEQKSEPEPKPTLSKVADPVASVQEPAVGFMQTKEGSDSSNVDAVEKAKQDELTRQSQQIGLSNVWVEMKDKLSDSPTRSVAANDAYEAGLKKKRSLLKNSKGGMVDKKVA